MLCQDSESPDLTNIISIIGRKKCNVKCTYVYNSMYIHKAYNACHIETHCFLTGFTVWWMQDIQFQNPVQIFRFEAETHVPGETPLSRGK